MAETIKISIALAAYNGSRFIAEQLRSLLQQTRVPDEIIITDDSDDDQTFAAVKPFLSDPRIVYYKNETALNVSGNFAKAISLTRGEVIFLCDQDDVWLPGKVEKLYTILQENPDIDGVFCNSELVNAELSGLGITLYDRRKFSNAMQKQLNSGEALKVFLKRVTCSSHNIAFKRRALGYIMPLPELAPFYPDTFIGLSIAADSSWRAVPECLTLYRIHSNNESAPKSGNLTAAARARANRAAWRSAQLAEIIIARANGKLPAGKLRMLQKFAAFQKKRDAYSKNLFLRTVQVFFQAVKWNYCRFANGFRTMIADILIR